MTTTAPAAPDDAPVLPREGLTILLLGFAVVLVIMNTMMFNFALPAVSRAFALTPTATSWIVTAYSIVFAISSITYSRLSDFVPLRRLFVIGLLSLSLAAIAGFFSGNFVALIAARVVQATGAGSIPALGMVMIARYVPIERRGVAMALVMSGVALGLGLGPVVGGTIVQFLGWHYLFLMTALTLGLAPFFAALIPDETPQSGTFDVPGAVLAGLSVTALLLAMTTRSLLFLGGGLVGLVLFQWRIRKARAPFVLPVLFTNRSYLLLGGVGIGAYMCSFAALYLLPQILVHYHGLTAMQAGFVIFPGSLLSMLASRRVGMIIDRVGNRAILRWLPVVLLSATVLFAFFVVASFWAVAAIYSIMSLAFTFLTSGVSNEISRVLPPAEIGSGMGLFQLIQFFSGAFGVAATATTQALFRAEEEALAYAAVFWGMSAITLLSIGCAHFYLRERAGRVLSESAVTS